MTAPIRITPDAIAVPAPGDIIARVRCHDDLIEAFRVVKDLLGLSNTFCDDTIGITAGHTDKVLGPTRAKGLSSFMFDNFSELFAVEFEMRINLDAARRMQARWEGRENGRIHVDSSRVSKRMMERAKPQVLKVCGAIGGRRRAEVLSARELSDIGKKANRIRWKRVRKLRREAKREGQMSELREEAQGKPPRVLKIPRKAGKPRPQPRIDANPAEPDSQARCKCPVVEESLR